MKKMLTVIVGLAGACAGVAQEIGVVGLDTNANTVSLGGTTVSALSPAGAFLVGFGLMLTCCVFGMVLRSVRLIGHSGGDGL
jgi:hypothetical protein